jgi:hypothetical protein
MATKEFAVCIPFRSDNGGVRDDLMRFTVKWWRKNVPEAQVILGDALIDAAPGQFCRAWAINYAVEMAGDLADEVVLISDADTITLDPESIRHAVLTVRKQEEEDGQPHYIDNWNVWTKYKNANGDPVAMRGVIEEGRQ